MEGGGAERRMREIGGVFARVFEAADRGGVGEDTAELAVGEEPGGRGVW